MRKLKMYEKKARVTYKLLETKRFIEKNHYKSYTLSYCRKYVSRSEFGEANIEEYHGRYGDGIKFYMPNEKSSIYSLVEYYINDGNAILSPVELVHLIKICVL